VQDFSSYGALKLPMHVLWSVELPNICAYHKMTKIFVNNSPTLQVNLCQNLLLWHQLTHNMTTDCSIHENSKLKPEENMLCKEIVSDIQNNFCTQHVLPMFCEKKSFWQRFTCKRFLNEDLQKFYPLRLFGGT
jgi:hypothetical protein